jgi:hypothetical protein
MSKNSSHIVRYIPTPSSIRTEKLVQHILAYEKDGEALGIPFDLPTMTFYERCLEAEQALRMWILESARKNSHDVLACHVENILGGLHPPPMVRGRIQKDYERLKERQKWFTDVRKALRYRNGKVPLNTLINSM